jgi:hypothetical protein
VSSSELIHGVERFALPGGRAFVIWSGRTAEGVVPKTRSKLPLPATRKMSVVAQDPSFVRTDGRILMAQLDVPAEELSPGPIGYRVQVVDYDSSSGEYHGAHVLPEADDDEPRAWREGRPAIVTDRRFHAQNVYALVMKTLARFEFALGRRVGWSFKVHQLKVAPHGVLDANAFYSDRDEGLVFGYFPDANDRNVYTCLSQDIVVHETTHALLDALRERYLDPSGPDQAAFHEGWSWWASCCGGARSASSSAASSAIATSAPRRCETPRSSGWPSRWAPSSRPCAGRRCGAALRFRPTRAGAHCRSSRSRIAAARSSWPR